MCRSVLQRTCFLHLKVADPTWSNAQPANSTIPKGALAFMNKMTLGIDFSLVRDHLDNSRVNIQHYLWVKLFGYLLHPSIPTGNKNMRIADIGTATGIWLIDLADTLPPSVHLDGFDITLDATPPPKWLPPNMTLHHWDVRTEPPQEWIGTYDVVHVRVFSLIFDESEVCAALARFKSLLKPGGYLQWAECDMPSCKIEKTHPGNKVDAMTELLNIGDKEDVAGKWDWCSKLPDLFLQEGFENVVQDVRGTPPHLIMPFHECSLCLVETLVRRRMDGTKQGARYKALIQQVARETSQGSAWSFTRWTVIGRRPFEGRGVEGSARSPDAKTAHPGGHLLFPF